MSLTWAPPMARHEERWTFSLSETPEAQPRPRIRLVRGQADWPSAPVATTPPKGRAKRSRINIELV